MGLSGLTPRLVWLSAFLGAWGALCACFPLLALAFAVTLAERVTRFLLGLLILFLRW